MKIKLRDDYTGVEMDRIEFIKALRRLTGISLKDATVISKFDAGDGILTQAVVPSAAMNVSQFKEDIDILQENGYDVEIIGYSYIVEMNKIMQSALNEGHYPEAAILSNALGQLIEVNNVK